MFDVKFELYPIFKKDKIIDEVKEAVKMGIVDL